MDYAQNSFISSTAWTERIGPVAAIATIEKMQRANVPAKLVSTGLQIIEGLQRISTEYALPLSITGIPPLIYFRFNIPEAAEAQTYYAQEMLRRGFLVGGAIYTTYAYSDQVIELFLEASDAALSDLAAHLSSKTLRSNLLGETIHAGFRRLT